MNEPVKTILGSNPIDVLRYEAGVILTERDLARIAGALQGINAVATVLTQREIDAEDAVGGLTFSPALATGLLMALASCTDLAKVILDTGGLCGVRAEFDTDAYELLKEARNKVIYARAREEGGTV